MKEKQIPPITDQRKRIERDLKNEYMNYEMGDLMQKINARHQTAASGVSQQNGRVEKAIQDIMGAVRVSLHSACRGLDLWAEAAGHAAYHLNRMPCYANPDMASPYYMRYGRHPDYKRLQPFGQACAVMYPKKQSAEQKAWKESNERCTCWLR